MKTRRAARERDQRYRFDLLCKSREGRGGWPDLTARMKEPD